MALTETRRQQLDGIVKQMIQNKETDSNIQWVVQDFKNKYGEEAQPQQPVVPQSGGIAKNIGNAAIGFGKGILSTAKESSDIIGGIKEKIPKFVGIPGISATSLGALKPVTAIASKISPALSSMEESANLPEGTLTTPEGTAQKVGFYGEKIAELVNPIGVKGTSLATKKPLTLAAEKLYQSALKPRSIVKDGKVVVDVLDVVKTGLKEKVWLTKGGVERVASKIDDFESQLGDAIEAAAGQGKKISTKGLQSYLDEAKTFFENQIDVEEANRAVKEINALGKGFVKKYGKEIPIEEAQKVKVATGQMLRKYYDRMSSAGIEGQKQATRFLKDKIVEAAPQVGDINKRLSKLYQFDQALSKASGRIGNLNLLGLGTKFGAAAAGSKGAAIGLVADLLDKAAVKSGAAIGLNELAKLGGKGAVPLNALLGVIKAKIEEESD